VRHAGKPRIHTFVSTSPIHLEHQMRKSEEEVLEIITRTVAQARNLVEDVEWSAMDATRTPIEYLCRAVDAAIKAGATTINLPDTVGYALPSDIERIFTTVGDRIGNRAVLSAHCHNDLGLAVANSLAAVQAGARQVECTINGIGERAGNASLEEIVMALEVRADALPHRTNIHTPGLVPTSNTLSSIVGVNVPPNKAIVGANAFAHEAGIHQDGMLKYELTYEIMRPESVGAAGTRLVLGKHSGMRGLDARCRALGYRLRQPELERLYGKVTALADRTKSVNDEQLATIIREEMASPLAVGAAARAGRGDAACR
jgi:2-isopropylmalate synthase